MLSTRNMLEIQRHKMKEWKTFQANGKESWDGYTNIRQIRL